jgi:hypothetical protein
MSRSDQCMGVTPDARQFVLKYSMQDTVCPTCHQCVVVNHETVGAYYGMFMDNYPLHRYPLKSGGWADEFLQDQPWSSGPVAFIGLRVFDKDGEQVDEFLWPQDAINNC